MSSNHPPASPPPNQLRVHLSQGWQVELSPSSRYSYLTLRSDSVRRLTYYILKSGRSQWTPPSSPAHSRSPSPKPQHLPLGQTSRSESHGPLHYDHGSQSSHHISREGTSTLPPK